MAKKIKKPASHKLNQVFATAICGNDILSSVLYVSGIAITFAGVYAPLILLVIAFVLFLYKAVYTEVVEALPINGGAYNCLLNGTSKTIAAIAGITTFLSYNATAVISAKIAVDYVNTIFPLPVIPVTIGVLLVFAVLVVSGLKDSSKVALGIFSLHILTLIAMLILGLIFFATGHSWFASNLAFTPTIIAQHDNIWKALFLAFSASLLGVSGFESSANFVEEQDKGVFRKTLRNMLIGVAIFNPLMGLVVLNSLPFTSIANAQNFLLADVARAIGGPIFQYMIVIDAFLVLAGAVLTAYIGVSGLMSRMAADGCLPNFLAKRNKAGSFPWIVLLFFILCTSILITTHGNLLSLAGVYTISFLGVMTLFGLGNLILREARTELKRTYHAPLLFVGLASLATFFGIIGNVMIDPQNLFYFGIYFIPALLVILLIVYLNHVIIFLSRITKFIPPLHRYLEHNFHDLTEGKFVIFIRHADKLFRILDYINRNESGWNIYLVYCKNSPTDTKGFEELEHLIPDLQQAGVFPHFNITLLTENKPFGPAAINKISKKLRIRKNRMMIGSIHSFHPFDYDDLGGVRVIF